jgi:hypothetical protein
MIQSFIFLMSILIMQDLHLLKQPENTIKKEITTGFVSKTHQPYGWAVAETNMSSVEVIIQ